MDEKLIWRINNHYQRLYSAISALTFLSWGLLFGLLLWQLGWGWLFAVIMLGSTVLSLFVMRIAIYRFSPGLNDQVNEHLEDSDRTLDELIALAKELPRPPQFFLTLVDGPLARSRRKRDELPALGDSESQQSSKRT